MKNFIPVDLGNPDLSSKIAKYVAEHPRLLGHAGSDRQVLIESLDCYEPCRPLVDAVNQLCSWQDVVYIILFNFNPGVEIIHRDSLIDHEYFWALNVPILNCHDPYTSIYELLPEEQGVVPAPEEYAKSGIHGYTTWQPNQVKEIDRMHLIQPFLFDISTVHCVHNPTNQPRLSLSIRTKCNLLEKYKLMQK